MTLDSIKTWPKAELHSHLDGAMRLETMLSLAREQGKMALLPADSVEGLHDVLLGVDTSESLAEYLAWFQYTIGLMQDASSLRRVAYEMAEDFATENVRYLEVRFGPILHTEEGLSLEQVLDAVLDGLRAASHDFGIRTGVIVCALRDRYMEASVRQAQAAVSYIHRGVVGFDLAGGEAGNPAKQHLEAFYIARNHLLGLTVHAGESWGPESIRQALFYCGAHRIGHGITMVQDPELLEYAAMHRIPLEICPTSNVQTHVVPSYEEHPLKVLIRSGVPVSINTDSRLFSHTSTSEELYLAHSRCGLTEDETRAAALATFDHAFLPHDERAELARSARLDLDALAV
ncbi:MAG: adenosine deaminase [Bacteroidetes bacterium CG12_big_fil_rev_8_21_14_0_65_60_17]|nr:MAG: adenosine deaminase [Bacteroidetes bacterium CG12_big_fil_rev_8_21_14_0_65_60_17]